MARRAEGRYEVAGLRGTCDGVRGMRRQRGSWGVAGEEGELERRSELEREEELEDGKGTGKDHRRWGGVSVGRGRG